MSQTTLNCLATRPVYD